MRTIRRLGPAPALCLALALVLTSACGGEGGGSQTVKGPDPDRGRRLYIATCIVCHNSDPGKDGSLGPAVKGASEALLEAKVLHKRYPPGYRPKRPTQAMPTYPQLRKRIPDIAAYLAQP